MHPAFPSRNIPIVFSTDDNYAPYLYTAADSLIDNLSAASYADILVLVERPLHPRYVEALGDLADKHENVSIRFVPIPEDIRREIASLPCATRYGPAAYYRLYAARILPRFDRIIYCDVDVVIPGDLSDLYATDMGNSCIGACLDILNATPRGNETFHRYVTERLGMASNESYFNSGVLLMNLHRMRSEGWEQRMTTLLPETASFDYPDQDLLNLAFEGGWYPLPMRWNYFSLLLSDERPDAATRQAYLNCRERHEWGVIHFIGTNPWSVSPLSERNPEYFVWAHYAMRNPMIDWEPVKKALVSEIAALRSLIARKKRHTFLLPTAKRKNRLRRMSEQLRGLEREAHLLESRA